ncbi:MAG TPA: LysR family transcriptional regulator [Paracoccaceae bacterium]|nr:LysR family transcriptional regulator [Paracoccaceae bacterium]
MDIRQLQYLVALSHERHFSRAAAACHVTQPTLSGRIRQLEQELGVALIERGQRFHGFTPEGERVLAWATRIVENVANLTEELAGLKGSAGGRLVLGVVPSALPTVPPLSAAIAAALPGVSFTVFSQSSNEILQHLNDFTIDAGLTYLDNEPVPGLLAKPLYTERYRLFVRAEHPLAARRSLRWGEAAQHPLCLLTPNMQNRRIIDATFRRAGARVTAEIESNSVVTLCAHVRVSGLATVLPEYFAGILGAGLRAIPLTEPKVEHAVGLVTLDRDPLPRLVAALMQAAEGYRLPPELLGR